MPGFQELGGLIRAAREARGWEQRDLALRLGLRQQAVSGWERGISRPSRKKLAELVRVLKVIDEEPWIAAADYTDPSRPVRPLTPTLPFDELPPEQFERLCRELLASLHPDADVHRYGGPGDTQHGVDVTVTWPNGRRWVVQCKRVRTFGPRSVREAIDRVPMTADRYLLLLSRPSTAAAREEMLRHPRWDLWDQEDLSSRIRELPSGSARRLVDTYFPNHVQAFLGLAEPGPWLTAEEFFGPHLDVTRVFSHGWDLVGRSTHLSIAQSFLDSGDRRALLVRGAGGSGKSRLLREIAARAPKGMTVRFALPGLPLGPRELEELPWGHTLVLVDDAHDRNRDDLFAFLAAAAAKRPKLKLVLATRSYAFARMASDIRRTGLDDDPVECAVRELDADDARALSEQVLDRLGASPAVAETIARLTYDSPFATVVGSHLVATDKADPRLLASHERFRESLFDHFRDVMTGAIGDPPDRAAVQDVLELLATVQPIEPGTGGFHELASDLFRQPAVRITRALHALQDTGIIVQRARRLRISPDLLADLLLEDACVDRDSGTSTGFAEQVFGKADGATRRQVLVNVSKLDWRLAATSSAAAGLADSIWHHLADEFQAAGIHDRLSLLSLLEDVAYYQPRRTLDVVRLAVTEPVADSESTIPFFRMTYQDVLDGIPPVLRNVALHPDYLDQAAEILWRLARAESESRGSLSDRPLEVLRDLVGLEPGKPIWYSERLVQLARSWLDDPMVSTYRISPFDVLDSALASAGLTSSRRGGVVTLTPFLVATDAVRSLRESVVAAALMVLHGADVAPAARALRTIQQALRPADTGLGQLRTEAGSDGWIRERVELLERLATSVADSSLDPVLLADVQRLAARHARYGPDTVRQEADRVLAAIPDTLDNRLARAIVDAGGETFDRGDADYAAHWQRVGDWRRSVARELLAAYPVDQLLRLLEDRLALLRAVSQHLHGSPGPLVSDLVSESPDVGHAVATRVLEHPDAPLVDVFASALAALGDRDRHAAAGYAEQALVIGDTTLRRAVGEVLTWLGTSSALDPLLTPLAVRLARDPDVRIRSGIAEMAGLQGRHDRSVAVECLLALDVSDSGDVLENASTMLEPSGPVRLSELPSRDRDRLLAKLEAVPDISGYHIGRFLGFLSEVSPETALDLLFARFARAEDSDPSYEPIPFDWPERSPLAFRSSDSFVACLRTVRDWSAQHDAGRHRHDRPSLFASVASGFDAVVLDVLAEWVDSPRREDLEVVARLLSRAHRTFVWDEPALTARLLDRATGHGRDSLTRVARELRQSAESGDRSGLLGQPFPEDVEQRDLSRETAGRFPAGSPARRFYEDLARSADRNIAREAEEDAELYE